MASIQISELCPAGLKLFQDSESFLSDLTDNEITSVKGGNWILDLKGFLIKLTVESKDFPGYLYNGSKSVINLRGNSVHNNTYNGYSINAVSYSNANSIAGI